MALGAGSRRVTAFVLGLGLLQALWIVTVPPFAASDEFEHVYRAAGVAVGEFKLDLPAEEGRGELTRVPSSLVAAASAQCARLGYTGPDTCFGARAEANDDVLVATAAGSYNPAFYLVIGTLARPFEGATALYVMRTSAAALCLLLFGIAAWLQRRRGSWTHLGLIASLTPTLVYTTSIGAPNGAEIAAGLLLWVALLELADEDAPQHLLPAFWFAVLAASLLVTLRLLGPLFLIVIVLCAALLGGSRAWDRLRPHPRQLLAGCGVLLTASLLSVGWIVLAGQLKGGDPTAGTSRSVSEALVGVPMSPATMLSWIFQALAAFPYRNNLVPGPVYVVLGTLVIALLVAALIESRGRVRAVMLVALISTMFIPVVLTVITRSSHADIWQGRYILPLGVGFVLLAGRAIDCSVSVPVPLWVSIIVGATVAGSASTGLLVVRGRELDNPASIAGGTWYPPAPILMVTIAIVASVLLVLAAREADSRAPDPGTDSKPNSS